LREPAAESAELTTLPTLTIEALGTLCSRCFELSAPQRVEPIAQLAAIEIRGVAGHSDDVGVCGRRESRWQQPRGRICFVNRG